MRIVAVFTVYNERRFMRQVLEHTRAQGIAAYVIDNQSSDETRSIAEGFLGNGVIGIETLPREGVYDLARILTRVQELTSELGADWYLLSDADQFRFAPKPYATLAEGIAAMDAAGFNAIDFDVFDFLPTTPTESHEDGNFLADMKHYSYFRPPDWHQLKCWKSFGQKVDIVSSGGHCIAFEGKRVAPIRFVQRHYYALSAAHAIEKYCEKRFSEKDIARGWHGARARLRPEDLRFPDRSALKRVSEDGTWDTSDPRSERILFRGVAEREQSEREHLERKQPEHEQSEREQSVPAVERLAAIAVADARSDVAAWNVPVERTVRPWRVKLRAAIERALGR